MDLGRKYWRIGDKESWGTPPGIGAKCDIFVLCEVHQLATIADKFSMTIWTRWPIMWMPVNFFAQPFHSLLKRADETSGCGIRHGNYIWSQ